MVESGPRPSTPRVCPEERTAFEAWGLWLRVHAGLVDGLDLQLRTKLGMTISTYDLLAQVAAAPGRRILMHELEKRVLFSQSTVSRVAARLEQEGLIERAVCAQDRRALEVGLTAAGVAGFGQARRLAIEYLRERFVGPLAGGQDGALKEILQSLSSGLDRA